MYRALRLAHRGLGKVHWALVLIATNDARNPLVRMVAYYATRPIYWACRLVFERAYAIGERRLREVV